MRSGLAGLILALGLGLTGCATSPPSAESLAANDPYEAVNRDVFAFNMWLDRHVLIPTATLYADAVPEPARDGIHNVLQNLDSPITFANDVLQGEVTRAGQTLGRFGINSTLGLGGLLDVASRIGIPYHSEDFGQTLGVYGAGPGPYLVLPLLGPDGPRDMAGQIVDIFLDPLSYVQFRERLYWSAGRTALSVLDLRSRNLGTLQGIESSSVDYYASIRSLYRQLRENEVRNGRPDAKDLPNF